MAKVIPVILILSFLLFSCQKSSPPNQGTWTFQSITYHNNLVHGITGPAVAAVSSNPSGILDLTIANSIGAGTYPVLSSTQASGGSGVTIQCNSSINSNEYYSTGGQTVTISIGSSGVMTISGSGITMKSAMGDSSTLSLNIVTDP